VSWLRTREATEKDEALHLAPYACHSRASRGRVVPEPDHAYRTVFQRDRDRIVHASAFRRLEYKTQVFVLHEGDHYRNRLTHSLEGAQIARTIAHALCLCEELAEAIALAHDLGHTPFGHAGEGVLAELMRDDGGFDHNRQSLRVVDWLEERYPGFRGLNLTDETREGILKHGCHWEHPVPLPELGRQRSLEAQAADSADEIAYTNHDLDDGLRAGLLDADELEDLALWREARAEARARSAGSPARVLNAQTIIALINRLVTDLIENSAARLAERAPESVDDVRQHDEPLIGLSASCEHGKLELKRYLREHFYRHREVLRMTRKAEWIVRDLYQTYREHPELLPPAVLPRFEPDGKERAIADYLAGMTDRFALAEHRRLLDPHAG